jgi:hypothetical protein
MCRHPCMTCRVHQLELGLWPHCKSHSLIHYTSALAIKCVGPATCHALQAHNPSSAGCNQHRYHSALAMPLLHVQGTCRHIHVTIQLHGDVYLSENFGATFESRPFAETPQHLQGTLSHMLADVPRCKQQPCKLGKTALSGRQACWE